MGDPVEKTNTLLASSSSANSLTRQSVVLAMVLAVPFPVIAWVQVRSHGQDGLMATVVGAAVCLVAGILALAITGLAQEIGQGLNGLLGSIFIRTGIPLAAGVFFHSQGGPLADAGVFGVIMVYYLLMLTAETMLAVSAIRKGQPTASNGMQETTAIGSDPVGSNR